MAENYKVSGIIKAVSEKNYGICIGTTWYNAVDDAKKEISSSLKGKQVCFAPQGRNEFDSFEIIEAKEQTQSVLSQNDYWARREVRDLENDKIIRRMNALGNAVRIYEQIKKPDDMKADSLATHCELLAQRLLEWIEDKEEVVM